MAQPPIVINTSKETDNSNNLQLFIGAPVHLKAMLEPSSTIGILDGLDVLPETVDGALRIAEMIGSTAVNSYFGEVTNSDLLYSSAMGTQALWQLKNNSSSSYPHSVKRRVATSLNVPAGTRMTGVSLINMGSQGTSSSSTLTTASFAVGFINTDGTRQELDSVTLTGTTAIDKYISFAMSGDIVAATDSRLYIEVSGDDGGYVGSTNAVQFYAATAVAGNAVIQFSLQ